MSCPMQESTTPPSVERVMRALAAAGATGQVRPLDDSARTAKEAAAALGVEVGQIASSLIFLADGEPVLVVASGGHRVDTAKVASLLGAIEVGKATADDVRAATSFVIGGVAPLGFPTPIRTLVDVDLGQYDEVWAAGGHSHWVFPTTFAELLRLTGGESAAVGQ